MMAAIEDMQRDQTAVEILSEKLNTPQEQVVDRPSDCRPS
jgi:hypothetical protein